MSRKAIDSEFKKAVWSQGFSLEHDVFMTLEKDGWELLPNRYFRESPEGQIREYDLLAYKIFKWKGLTFFLVLIIECKFNPHKIVFYVRKLKNDSYPLIYFHGEEFAKTYSFESVAQTLDSLKQYKKVFFSEDQVFGYQTFAKKLKNIQRGISKGNQKNFPRYAYYPQPDFTDRIIYKAISTVASAVRYEVSTRNKENAKKHFYLFLPLVIFSGKLYQATLAGKCRIKRERHFRYKTGIASLDKDLIPTEYYVHIIDTGEFPKFVRFFNQLYKKFANDIRSIKKS